ncbi:MAG: 50S ribosomal protein L29 [Omnitrophica bacterium RIFCSPLOWO2_12_FULL_44_17]|uniref:Large ribosomal subunit protein uL29 n=1 Tax=Candidatus Danuiimicrobium aquiferis TaxID=1801832 RepID=A0A1G1L012_9BACT|nr:MAG: 50S ribosomal protein L29 [Omnitrophica bacterium RIFCSPHIGHO2_02_FULL_45_28]OGW91781.1 MAG: 50S ribosomal protein L29 [Omnitrophica bacterium RIFCSPHIGHO2_12_FULL_44_12]OGW98496.1 MAG: 50S ribosomal protein L29 [Omnitrophica bacterium RIFCSPLOWO2_12_FULL_44_17]OGX02942.1 MAG: 50S ribosomal protein L29 [Omnitrophica bacterium RIFCSPLOWO2_02_FULL_44_11]
MKAKELKALSIDELEEKAQGLKKSLYQLRFDAKVSKLENVLKIRQTRRDLAKVLTVIRELELNKND